MHYTWHYHTSHLCLNSFHSHKILVLNRGLGDMFSDIFLGLFFSSEHLYVAAKQSEWDMGEWKFQNVDVDFPRYWQCGFKD